MITPGQVAEAVAALDAGELVLFGADTVYGLACRPGNEDKLAAIKGRDPGKPNALMAFSVEAAGPLLGEAGAAATLLPGPVTLVLPSGAGLRVPALAPEAAALAAIPGLVSQTSANRSGEPAPARLEDVGPELLAAAAVVLDAGPLPGIASTVVDLRGPRWEILRAGAVVEHALAATLGPH